ncbi:unnamed protein product [Clonostachys solani]|uniref:Uncharacterized protein n=1 Tax=Clonostachys solani TaxID=160281 RepID=A0A9N9YYU0_9HYPO|nr:unnamed protein product [Clonostachys solani]
MSSSTRAKYNLTEDPQAVPQFLLDAYVWRFHVEFLELNWEGMTATETEKAKNHVILKVDLIHEVEGIKGVRLDMRIGDTCSSTESDDGKTRYKLGKLIVHPVDYEKSSARSVRTCSIETGRNFKFGEIIIALTASRIQDFHFVDIGDSIQALHLLKAEELVGSRIIESFPDSPAIGNDIYRVLGLRFTPEGSVECPIDKGYFSTYQRQETGDMPYAR